MKRRIKSKSSRMNRHRILTKPKLSKAGSFTREFYHFHLSFVCFIYYREMFLSSCFLLQLCCHCFVIVTGFNFPPSSRLCFTSFYWLLLHPPPQPAPARFRNCVHVSFHSTNIHTNIFQSSNSIHKSHFTSAAAAGASREVFKFYFNVCTEH